MSHKFCFWLRPKSQLSPFSWGMEVVIWGLQLNRRGRNGDSDATKEIGSIFNFFRRRKFIVNGKLFNLGASLIGAKL
jgi:hypothetical protein